MKKKVVGIFVCMLLTISIITPMLAPRNFIVDAATIYYVQQGQSIQNAIQSASYGDTVYVYNGTYYEKIVVDESIHLTGENKNTTIIDGGNNGNAVTIMANYVNMSDFTILNSGESEYDAGIKIKSDYVNIYDNIIKDCSRSGLILESANNNVISNNIIFNTTSSICIYNSSSYNNITNNNITFCTCAIDISNGSNNNDIFNNTINNNLYGIFLWDKTTNNNSISVNCIENSTYVGLLIDEATGNCVYENNFKNNEIGIDILYINSTAKNQFFHNNFIDNTDHSFDKYNQTWNGSYFSGGNYWDTYMGEDLYHGPNQDIQGSDGICDFSYNITGKNSRDYYPLIQPWNENTLVAIYSYSIDNMKLSLNASRSYDWDNTITDYVWDFGDGSNGTGILVNHTYTEDETRLVTLNITNDEGIYDTFSRYIFIGNDSIPPDISNVSNIPNTVGFGFNVTINADATDNISGIDMVKVNITYPDNSSENFTMNHTSGDTYEYVFSDTWLVGQYNYTIWAVDNAENINVSSQYSFNVSANATISVCTIKDEYGNSGIINITDPPLGGGSDEETSFPPIGYELLDDNKVLHIWNRHNDYYFNTSSGIQLTNHYNEYWSHNVLMLGYYNNDEWHLIYRTDELNEFNKDIETDNETYINATLWKDLSYGDYDFRLAIRYHLSVNDSDLTVIPYIKNLGQAIPYDLAFGWEINDIKIDNDVENDQMRINGTSYLLNQTLDIKYKNLTKTFHEDNEIPDEIINRTVPDSIFNLDNVNDGIIDKTLYLKWNHTLDYLVCVKSRDGQHNAPVTLFIKVGTLDIDQEKSTELHWLDYTMWELQFSFDVQTPTEDFGHVGAEFDGTYFYSTIWTSNIIYQYDIDGYLVDSFSIPGVSCLRDLAWDGTYMYGGSAGTTIYIMDFVSKTLMGNITTSPVVVRSIAYDPTADDGEGGFWVNNWGSDLKLIDRDGAVLLTIPNSPSMYGSAYDGDSPGGPYLWVFTTDAQEIEQYNLNTYTLTGVKHSIGDEFPGAVAGGLWFSTDFIPGTKTLGGLAQAQNDTIFCYEVYGTPNNAPTQTGESPTNGSTGISTTPPLHVICNDADSGDTLTATWRSNSSGSWVTFETNSSITPGTTITQTNSNFNAHNTTYYWKVSLTDGTDWCHEIYHFTTYIQSKIENTGSTNINGYLLMQVQYNNSGTWVVDTTVVNDSLHINSSEQLPLDQFFNGEVNTSDLSHGNGTYRVYVALRDPNGNVLQTDDSTYLNASYEFSVSFETDSDSDGWTDYEEINFYYTDPQNQDTDGDGVNDTDDIDPLIDLKVTLTTKRIYASEYTYTWRESESWDNSNTNSTDAGDDTDWINSSDSSASNGCYTRQNDSMTGLDDFAKWNFTVLNSGIYYFWMRSHRYEYASSNIKLYWIDDSGTREIYDRLWDDKAPGYEICLYQNTTDEWKWSWYGVLDLSTGDATLRIENPLSDYPLENRPDYEEGWMEVDNILITDDPNCHPSGKGVEGSEDNTIGCNTFIAWDQPGEGPGGSGPDFYVKTTIAGNTNQSSNWTDDHNVLDDWSATVNVPDNDETVEITIELWEEDGVTDTLCDIGTNGKKCNITYNLENATWWGDDHVLDTDFIGRTCGEVDGSYSSASDANVIFSVSQNDYDNDGITYWQESYEGPYKGGYPIDPTITNDRYAVIIGAGASCKVKQEGNIGDNDSPYKGTYLLYDEGDSWTDYTVTVDIMTNESLGGDKEDIGIMFRIQDENNYYILRWEEFGINDRIFLWKIVNGVYTDMSDETVRTPLTKGVWYSLRVEVDGENIKVQKSVDNNVWTTLFDVEDSTFSSGSIALFCWKNTRAWFDDVIVIDDEENVLLEDGFDHGKFFDWTAVDDATGTSDWKTTNREIDQEDFYIMPDFVYRELKLIGHYKDNNIMYENADKWRDADGDGQNDVDSQSTRNMIKYGVGDWLSESSDDNDLNLIYVFDHGINWGVGPDLPWQESIGYFGIDDNRNGKIDHGIFNKDVVYDFVFDLWLPSYKWNGIGRLTFVIEACFIGHFLDAVGRHPLEKRIVIASTEWNTSAGGETGQDWPAFSHMLFKSMADGETDVATAFNIADEHVDTTNFLSIWACYYYGVYVPTDSKLDDNGDGDGSDYLLGGNWPWQDGYLAKRTGL